MKRRETWMRLIIEKGREKVQKSRAEDNSDIKVGVIVVNRM